MAAPPPPEITLEDPSVVQALELLKQLGFTLGVLQQCADSDLDSLVPQHLTPLEALKVKVALRRDREERKQALEEQKQALEEKKIYTDFLPYVGRIEATFEDGVITQGNCVLVGNPAFAVTALHVLLRVEGEEVEVELPSKSKGSTSKRRAKRRMVVQNQMKAKEIKVIFPNTQAGVLIYDAEMVFSSENDDLALIQPLGPLPQRFSDVRVLQSWTPYKPQVDDKVLYLAFPGCRGEARVSNSPNVGDDLPWYDKGIVTCYETLNGQGFAKYSSFGGSSGALIVHPASDRVLCRLGIHLGIYHESEAIAKWHPSSLPQLNAGISEKASNGYFTVNVGPFLQSYFTPKQTNLYLHPQVVYVKQKEKSEVSGKLGRPRLVEYAKEIEVLEDLCGPWRGLDDDELNTTNKMVSATAEKEEMEVLENLGSLWPGLDDADQDLDGTD